MAKQRPSAVKRRNSKARSASSSDDAPKAASKTPNGIPPEMLAFWESFTPEQRASVLAERNITELIIDTYSTFAEKARALGIKVTNPIIISSDGEMFDPSTYNIDSEDEDESDEDDTIEADEDEDEDEDIDLEEVEWDGPKIIKSLKKWMKESDWTQEDVADVLGVSQAAVSAWMEGRVSQPRNENCEAMVLLAEQSTDISPEDLPEDWMDEYYQ